MSEGSLSAPKLDTDVFLHQCSQCGEHKPPDGFHRDKDKKSGLATRCKECRNAYHRRYREEHGERIRASQRRYREEHGEPRRAAKRE